MNDEELKPNDSPTALKIIDAAAQLFMQRGYTAVSISDIIRAAKVTKPTLYYYFADKEELFLHTGLRVLDKMGGELQATLRAPGGFQARLLALAESMLSDSDRDVRMMRHEMWEHIGPGGRARLAQAFFRQLYAPIIALMEEGLAAGHLTGYPPPTLATMFMGMAEAFQEHGADSRSAGWAETGDVPVSATPLTPTMMVDMFLHGAGGPNARPIGGAPAG